MNIDYSRFYRGTTNIPSYGNGAYKKDTLVKYEFNTTDEHGNKVMDKMSKEETLKAMKDICSQYGDAVIVEFSGDGMAALVEDGKNAVDNSMTKEQRDALEARSAEFQKEITQVDKSINLPAASETEGASYLGHDSNLVQTTNVLDMMQTMDSSAYEEYQKISKESSNEDRQLNSLKYLVNWYESAVKKKPSMVADYEKRLQDKNPQINITAGKPDKNVKTANRIGKTDVRIAPEILNKMKNNPAVAAKYENMLSKIPALDKWADSMIKAMTGSEVKYRQVWIDEDGNMGSMVITGPSDEQKKADEERKAEEKKANEKRLAERRAERKEQTKKSQEDRRIFATGTDIKSLTENVVAQVMGTTSSFGAGFDRNE